MRSQVIGLHRICNAPAKWQHHHSRTSRRCTPPGAARQQFIDHARHHRRCSSRWHHVRQLQVGCTQNRRSSAQLQVGITACTARYLQVGGAAGSAAAAFRSENVRNRPPPAAASHGMRGLQVGRYRPGLITSDDRGTAGIISRRRACLPTAFRCTVTLYHCMAYVGNGTPPAKAACRAVGSWVLQASTGNGSRQQQLAPAAGTPGIMKDDE